MSKYFITGATGTVGREVIHHLIKKGERPVAASRHTDKAKTLFSDNAQAVHFDFNDPSTFHAVDGSDGVFVLGPPLELSLFEMMSPFIDYLKEKNIGNVIYLSANGMNDLSELPFHGQMEEKLKSLSIEHTILRPGFFMQNFGHYERENIEQRKIVFSPAGEGKTAFISTKDIGEAAATILLDKSLSGKVYTLLGPELISYFDAAQHLSEILGEKISYPNPDDETYREALKMGGAPDFIAAYMIPVYNLIRSGKVANQSNDIEKLIEGKPETLRTVLERDFKS